MGLVSLYAGYVRWHYSDALREFVGVWGNVLWFTLHFFAVPTLLRTLFSPWRRLHEDYVRRFDIGKFFSTLLINILMRFVGVLIRLVFICFSVALFFILALCGALFLMLWIVAPVFLIAALFIGILFLL